MKKLFKIALAAGLLMASPAGNRNNFKAPQSRMMMVGGGKPDLAKMKMKVKELRKMASAMKIRGRSKAVRKADLIALIQKAVNRASETQPILTP